LFCPSLAAAESFIEASGEIINWPRASSLYRGAAALSGFGASLNSSDAPAPNIPPKWVNVDSGFNITFGKSFTTGSSISDYLLPLLKSPRECLFVEYHGATIGYWRTKSSGPEITAGGLTDSSPNRGDGSLGGGYRKLFGASSIVGCNSFFDVSIVFDKFYYSWGWGLEFSVPANYDSAIDFHFNQYGDLFREHDFLNAFRAQGSNSLDFGGGYSVALFDRRLDLRLGVDGYRFVAGENEWGWRESVELTGRDGCFTLRYEHGHDRIDQSYDSIGVYMNSAFDLDNLLKWANPFADPEPVFKNSRNIDRNLTAKTRRNWHQPSPLIIFNSSK
jgi:hypothetical protein